MRQCAGNSVLSDHAQYGLAVDAAAYEGGYSRDVYVPILRDCLPAWLVACNYTPRPHGTGTMRRGWRGRPWSVRYASCRGHVPSSSGHTAGATMPRAASWRWPTSGCALRGRREGASHCKTHRTPLRTYAPVFVVLKGRERFGFVQATRRRRPPTFSCGWHRSKCPAALHPQLSL